MLNRFLGKNFHDHFHIFGLCALAIGLPTSKVIMSLASMLLLLNILLEADFKTYWIRLKNNKLFLVLLAFWSLHLISLLWTSDFTYAFNDIRIKITLLLLPLLLAIKPVSNRKNLNIILSLLIATLFVISLYNIASYKHIIGNKTFEDIRGLSQFGSHIRFGILIALGAGFSMYYLSDLKTKWRWLFLLSFSWFCYYTYYSQVLSGVVALAVVIFVLLIHFAFRYSKKLGYAALILTAVTALLPFVFLFTNFEREEIHYDYNSLTYTTPSGNQYTHFLNENTCVNGKPIFVFVCEKELRQEWNKKSAISYDSTDRRKQPLRFTLMRYMTSKNLKKDSLDFQQLTKTDIQNIENGIAGVEETESGLLARIDGVKFQLKHSDDPNGHSLLQRLAYWKAGIEIIKKNWLLGVGVGDVQTAFNNQYTTSKSPLFPENRLRAHNSYLTSWISFGIFGFILFLLLIIHFLRFQLVQKNVLGIMFILVAISTFFIEDTLETQLGVTFFAFFYGLFSVEKIKKIS